VNGIHSSKLYVPISYHIGEIMKPYDYDRIAIYMGNTAQLKVLVHLFNVGADGDYLSGIANATGLSHSSVSRVVIPLLETGIVVERRLGAQVRIFTINSGTLTARKVDALFSWLNSVESDI